MTPSPTLLGIDLGTSSVKVMLTDAAGAPLARSTHDYPVDRPHPDWAETDPATWWTAVRKAVHDIRQQVPDAEPAGIGLCGQMHGVVLCDGSGAPTRPAVLWADARAQMELELYRRLDPDVGRRLANPLSPGMAGPILAWLSGHEPDVVAASRSALQPKDWLRARLTGRQSAEPSDASATLLFDVLSEGWAEPVVAALGLRRDLLPALLSHSGEAAGNLTAEIALELGLPPGIAVAAGAADTAAAALGSGLLAPGAVQLTIGTGVQIVTPTRPPQGTTLPAAPVTHLYRSATRDGWYAMAAGLTGGSTLSWVRRVLDVGWPDLYAAAGRSARSDDPIFLPHLIGERTPHLDTAMRGAWTGLSTRHDREALLYAALEGVAFAVAEALEALPQASGRGIRLAGGGTTAPAWRDLLADVLRVELHAVDVPEASARGAALLGGMACGVLDENDLAAIAATPTARVAVPRSAPLLEERRARYDGVLAALRDTG